jgi:hypothetical protein
VRLRFQKQERRTTLNASRQCSEALITTTVTLAARHLKGRQAMQPSPEFSSHPLPTSAAGHPQPSHASTVVYQGMTLAAMLLLLCTLWVF